MTIFGDGSQTRAFTHVADVAPILAAAADHPGARNQVFNVGADVPCSVGDLAAIVADALGVPLAARHEPARNEVQHAWASHEKVRRVFDPPPPVPLAEGIARMAEWVRRAGVRESAPFSAIEVARGLPPIWRRDA